MTNESTPTINVEIDNNDFFEPVPAEQPKVEQADDTSAEEQPLPEGVELSHENLQQAAQEFYQNMVDNFGEDDLNEFNRLVDGLEGFVIETETIAKEAFGKNEPIDPSASPVNYQDERFTEYQQKVAAVLPIVEKSGKLPESFKVRVKDLIDRLYRADYYLASLYVFPEEHHSQIVKQLDDSLLRGIYQTASFQMENTLRTLQTYRRNNALNQTIFDEIVTNLDTIRDTHFNYLAFNELETGVLLETYGMILEVLDEIRELANLEPALQK